jgi:hypothetical protein
MGIINEAIKSVPILGQAKSFYDVVKNVTNATDIKGVVLGGLQIIKEECIPPPFKLSVECTLLFAEIGDTILLATNPVTGVFSMSLAIGSATRMILRRL